MSLLVPQILGTLHTIMSPLYWGVSVLLLGWHKVFGGVFGRDSGWSWALSIVGLTIVIRMLLIPLFVKQIRSSRNMQLLQPKMKALQEKYGHDREKLGQEMMKMYKETGTNPLSSCLPILIQAPIFFALFRVLNQAAHDKTEGRMTASDVQSLSDATIFGAPISATFRNAAGPAATNIHVLAIVLIVLMTATMFLTQLQLMRKNMPKAAQTGQAAQIQKIMLYLAPGMFLIGGFNFPIGVLIYWLVSNLWTMGQQFYIIRRNPAPGTPAYDAMQERRKATGSASADTGSVGTKSGASSSAASGGPAATATKTETKPRPTVNQPKKQSRAQRKRKPGGT